MFFIRKLFIVFIASIFFVACLEDEMIPTRVVSEEIVFVSGETAILTGRIISNSQLSITDHGYEISSSEDFSNPIIISLGEKNIPGRFVAETNSLEIFQQYYCRSYANESGTTLYGNTLSFNTLKQVLVDFEPKIGRAGQKIKIEASNLTQDTRVLFNDKLIPSIELSNESFIEFTVPALEDNFKVDVKVISQNDTLCFEDQFEYIIGVWTEEEEFINFRKQKDATYIETEEFVMYGMGTSVGSQFPIELIYKMDKATKTWEEMDYPYFGTIGAFTAGNYFGGGSDTKILPLDDELSLDNKIFRVDEEINLIGTMPVPLYGSIAHLINNKIYIYSGLKVDKKRNSNVFSYDIDSGEWNLDVIANYLFEVGTLSWTYNDKAYFLNQDGSIVENNPANNDWRVVGETFPAPVSTNGLAIQKDDMVYVGLFKQRKFLYELDMTTLSWKQKNSYPGSTDDLSSAGWINDGDVYILKNTEDDPPYIWSFDPEAF